MTIILLLATFVTFIVFGRLINKADVLPSAPGADVVETKGPPIVASSEVDRQVRAGIERRQTDRRKRAA